MQTEKRVRAILIIFSSAHLDFERSRSLFIYRSWSSPSTAERCQLVFLPGSQQFVHITTTQPQIAGHQLTFCDERASDDVSCLPKCRLLPSQPASRSLSCWCRRLIKGKSSSCSYECDWIPSCSSFKSPPLLLPVPPLTRFWLSYLTIIVAHET